MIYFSFDKLQAVYAYFVEKFDPYISKTYLKAYTPCSQEEYSQPMQSFLNTGSIAGAGCTVLGLGTMYISGGTLSTVAPYLFSACTGISGAAGQQAKLNTEIQNMCNQRLHNYTLLMNGIISLLISGGLFTVVAYFKSKINNGTLTTVQFVKHIYNYIFNAIYYNEHSYNLLDLITKRSLYGTLPREEIQELRDLHEAAKQREDDQKTILQINKIIDIVNSESRGALVTMGEQKGLRLRRRIKKLQFDATAEEIKERILQLPEEYRDNWQQMDETQPSHAEAIGIMGNAVANGASGILQMGVEQQKLRQQQFHQLFGNVQQVYQSINTPLHQAARQVLQERETKIQQRPMEMWLLEDSTRRARDFNYEEWKLNNRMQILRLEREEASKAAAAAVAPVAAPAAAAPAAAAPAGLPAGLPAQLNSESKKTQGGGRRRRSRKRRKRSRKQKRSKTRSRSRKRRRRSRKR